MYPLARHTAELAIGRTPHRPREYTLGSQVYSVRTQSKSTHATPAGLQIGLSPIETGLGWRLKISTFCSKNFSPILFWGADLGGRVPFSI